MAELCIFVYRDLVKEENLGEALETPVRRMVVNQVSQQPDLFLKSQEPLKYVVPSLGGSVKFWQLSQVVIFFLSGRLPV